MKKLHLLTACTFFIINQAHTMQKVIRRGSGGGFQITDDQSPSVRLLAENTIDMCMNLENYPDAFQKIAEKEKVDHLDISSDKTIQEHLKTILNHLPTLQKKEPMTNRPTLLVIACETKSAYLATRVVAAMKHYRIDFGDVWMQLAQSTQNYRLRTTMQQLPTLENSIFHLAQQVFSEEQYQTIFGYHPRALFPQHLALQQGTREVFTQLLQHTNSALKDEQGRTLLHIAAGSPQLDAQTLKTIFQKLNSNLETPNRKGQTPFHCAIQHKNQNFIALYAEKMKERHSSDYLHAQDNAGNSTLHYAAQAVMPDLIGFLCWSGVDANTANPKNNTTAMDILLSHTTHTLDHQRALNILLQYGARPSSLTARYFPIHTAVRQGWTDLLEYFAHYYNNDDNDYNIHAYDPQGLTPLLIALQQNDIVTIRLLMQLGVQTDWGYSMQNILPLHYAARYSNITTVTELLRYAGNAINTPDIQNNTPLHYAALNKKDPGVCTVLIDSGANVNAQNKNLQSPLTKAQQCGNILAENILLSRGATQNETRINITRLERFEVEEGSPRERRKNNNSWCSII
ncbi:MAG: ankyrin repeat domain-containing protein [Epsilonproteobacteria bacterium]|nr:ankyrin repeat domain-containing protein [Campylobacterota bacterium]